VTIAVTLCAPVDSHPVLMAHGSDGRAEIDYVRDRLRLGGGEPVQHARVDLLENLLAHRADPEVRLVADLEDTGGFMRLLEAVRIARPPAAIDPRFVEWRKDARGEHPVVADVEHWIGRASEELLTFSELGAPWAGHA
jgi:hypothetical protein